MTRVGLFVAAAAMAAQGGCGSKAPAATACMVDQDCPPDWSCEGSSTSGDAHCVAAPVGTCRPIDYSMVGMACAEDRDCKAANFYCSASLHECAINTCLSTGNDPIVCDQAQCPDATSGAIVECAPGCRAGTRNAICRSCFCESCGAADGGP
jgi:hypothetical protein